MFQVGECIIHGNSGVCRIEKIGTLEISKDRLYYTLAPVYTVGGKVYTPVDNEKVIMRPVISHDEAETLIDNMKDIEVLWVPDERKREQQYKEALKTCDCREWVRMLKTLASRKDSRAAAGKKVTASDEKYLHLAEENLFGELALALGMEKDKVGSYIKERVEDMAS